MSDASENASRKARMAVSVSMAQSRDGDLPEIPWWVEILFVQVGLPDKWLRSFLKSRKKAKSYLKSNKSVTLYTILIISSVLYTSPIIRQSRLNNQCIDGAREYVSESRKGSNASITAWAHRFCHGGII